MNLPSKSVIVLGLRWLLGGIFIWAALGKIANPQEFLANLYDYRIPAPEFMLRLVAVGLPWLELVCGLALLIGVWQESTLGVILLLLVIFLLATGQAWARGLDIDCGCFGTAIEKDTFLGSVAFAFFRNLTLFGIGAYLFSDSLTAQEV